MQALANSLQSLIQRTQPDRLERAFLFSAVTGLEFNGGEAVEVSVETAKPPATISPDRSAQERAPTVVKPAGRKIMPTVKVRVAPAGKGRANTVAPRTAIAAIPPPQPPLPATDA